MRDDFCIQSLRAHNPNLCQKKKLKYRKELAGLQRRNVIQALKSKITYAFPSSTYFSK